MDEQGQHRAAYSCKPITSFMHTHWHSMDRVDSHGFKYCAKDLFHICIASKKKYHLDLISSNSSMITAVELSKSSCKFRSKFETKQRFLKLFHTLSSSWWKNSFLNLCTVAKCSTSQNEQSPVNDRPYMDEFFSSGRDNSLVNRLPGYQEKQSDRSRTRQNEAVYEMQINHLIEEETGLDRLRAMYALGPDLMFLQEDTRMLTTIFYRSVLFGFLLNVVKAAQSESKRSKHSSPSQAVMKMGMNQVSDSGRVLREAAKNTLRLSGFAASLIYLSQSIAAYRNVSSPWEYAISASAAMSIVGLGKPPLSFAAGVMGGAVLGFLGGSLVCSMLSSAGASQEQRTLDRIREKLKQQRQQDELETFS